MLQVVLDFLALHLCQWHYGHGRDLTCIIREYHTGIIGNKGSLLMTGEHEHTVMRLHLEGEKAEQLIPAIDTKPPGGASTTFWTASGKASSRRTRSVRPGTR